MIRKYNLLEREINNELGKTYLITKLKNITKKEKTRKSLMSFLFIGKTHMNANINERRRFR